MAARIDEVDYAILRCLQECDTCWKKRVHSWICEHIDEVPRLKERSEQTIGRRIDALEDAGLVDNCITAPDEIDRDMIIAYKLTDDGRDALQAKRTAMLQDKVQQSAGVLLTGNGDLPIDRDALVALMQDEFDIDDAIREDVIAPLDTSELVAVLAIHYFNKHLDDNINRGHADLLTALLERSPELAAPLAEKNVVTDIRSTALATENQDAAGQAGSAAAEE